MSLKRKFHFLPPISYQDAAVSHGGGGGGGGSRHALTAGDWRSLDNAQILTIGPRRSKLACVTKRVLGVDSFALCVAGVGGGGEDIYIKKKGGGGIKS